MRILKATERKSMRDQLLEAQGGKCAWCSTKISAGTRCALDHDHTHHVVRGTLCLACNRAEGYIKKAMQWSKMSTELEVVSAARNYYLKHGEGSPHLDEPVGYGKVYPKRRKRKTK